MINTALFKPRNFITVAAIAIVFHILASPLYSAISGNNQNG